MSSITPFIHKKVVVMKEDTPASQAGRAMCENKVGCVVVINDKARISGIVTDRDLVCNLLAVRSDVDTMLVELMTSDPVTVKETAELKDVVKLMEENGIRRVPVISETETGKQHCVGIITLDDLIASQTIDAETVAHIVQSQIYKKRMKVFKSDTRSASHLEQTLNRFYKTIGKNASLNAELVPPVTLFILSSIVRRLHFTGAAHFISQLPLKLQDDLLDLPAGPDRSVNADSITRGLVNSFNFAEPVAAAILFNVCRSLNELIDPHELRHIRDQLPLNMQALFPYVPAA